MKVSRELVLTMLEKDRLHVLDMRLRLESLDPFDLEHADVSRGLARVEAQIESFEKFLRQHRT